MSFTAANARAFGQQGGINAVKARRLRPKRKSALSQVLALKEVAHRDATDDKTPVSVKAALMRAYVDLQEIDMALRGQGKPKPVEAKNAVPKRSKSQVSPMPTSVVDKPAA